MKVYRKTSIGVEFGVVTGLHNGLLQIEIYNKNGELWSIERIKPEFSNWKEF